jgi:hypothetical protein
MDLKDLIPDSQNRRTHNARNLGMVVDALKSVGAARSIVIDEDNVILAGNGVSAAAAEAGISRVRVIDAAGDELIAVRRSGLTEDQKRALAIYDNRTAELAEWNYDQLAADKAAGLPLQPFWTDAELAQVLAGQYQAGRLDPDTIPDERETDIHTGDLFALGPHRVICGDVTDPAIVAALCGTDRPALAFTSPPYAEQRKEQYGGIPQDQYVEWFRRVASGIRPHLSAQGHFAVNIKPHAEERSRQLYVHDLIAALVRVDGWIWVDEFCWLRVGIPQQVKYRFKNSFEPVYWFANTADFAWFPEAVQHASEHVPRALGVGAGDTNAARRQGKGGGAIQGNTVAPGMAYPSNVLDFRESAPAIGHPAAFPVRLPSFFVSCMTRADDYVIDPFCGSGTTIIACETLQRRGLGVDVSPRYVQLTIDRWEAFTGLQAEKL